MSDGCVKLGDDVAADVWSAVDVVDIDGVIGVADCVVVDALLVGACAGG